jgi:MerR family copper efflux transcriptional regulator
MNIGEAATLSGISAKMVRHYESLGLLPKVSRTDSGYRQYGDREVHTLRFIRRARDLGFSMAEISELLKLWQNRRRASGDVKRIALSHVADLNRRMAEMAAMKQTLARLADCCHGDDRPDCPILDELGDESLAVEAVHPRTVSAVQKQQQQGTAQRQRRPSGGAHPAG